MGDGISQEADQSSSLSNQEKLVGLIVITAVLVFVAIISIADHAQLF